MDQINNPFSPGAGSPPPELVGRDAITGKAKILLGRVRQRRSEKSLLLVGLRGVGKTVLLNEIERLTTAAGYHTITLEAHEEKPLAALLIPHLRKLLFELDRMAGLSNKVKRGLGVLKSFIGGIRLKIAEVEFGLDIEPERGTADSGDLETDLSNLFIAVAEAAQDRGTALAILIDEIQYFSAKELSALIMGMHKMQQLQLPLVLVGAGLPILTRLAGESKSYAERLFEFPAIGPLSETDAGKALRDPVKRAGVDFSEDAIKEIFRLTGGYPYFIQEWGYQSWNHATTTPISLAIVKHASGAVVQRLDGNFFRVRFDRLTPREKEYLRAMAHLGSGPQRSGDIAEVAFTVPLFDEFMLRALPDFSPRD